MDKIIPLSRTRSEADWRCPRYRYYSYDFQDVGLTDNGTTLELWMGTCLHDAFAAIGSLTAASLEVDINNISALAGQQLRKQLLDAAGEEPSQTDIDFADEQACLTQGLVLGFYKHVWPRLLERFPNILHIETPVTYSPAEGFLYRAKGDLILGNDRGETCYCVDPETPILKADLTWAPAKDLTTGTKLIGVEELPIGSLDKNDQGRRMARNWNTGYITKTSIVQKPKFRLELSDGTSVTCSDDHQWLIPNARGNKTPGGSFDATWKSTRELNVGAKLLKVLDTWKESDVTDYNRGYLAAALEGEGHLSQKTKSRAIHVCFSQKKNKMLDKFQAALTESGFTWAQSKTASGTYKDVYQTWLCGKAQTLKFLGTVRPQRLLDKLNVDEMGGVFPIKIVRVEKIIPLGIGDVVAIETSNHTYIANGIISHNCEYKSTSSKKDEWIESWEYSVQAHATAKAIEATLGFAPDHVQIVGLYKGYQQKGKQNSPFTYCYMQGQHNPPFTQGKALYDYKYGTKKFPVWELEGGVERWVANMPDEILIDQFPLTPPIFLDHDMVDTYFRQAMLRESEVAKAKVDLAPPTDPMKSQYVMDKVFPQHFNACRPAWGSGCMYKKLCHGARPDDPLSAGFTLRDRSHDLVFIDLQEVKESGD